MSAALCLRQRLQMRASHPAFMWWEPHVLVLIFFSKGETGIHFVDIFGDGALAENIVFRNFWRMQSWVLLHESCCSWLFVIFLAIKTFWAEVVLPSFQSATAYAGEVSPGVSSPHTVREMHTSNFNYSNHKNKNHVIQNVWPAFCQALVLVVSTAINFLHISERFQLLAKKEKMKGKKEKKKMQWEFFLLKGNNHDYIYMIVFFQQEQKNMCGMSFNVPLKKTEWRILKKEEGVSGC